jgi:hypothetical protein
MTMIRRFVFGPSRWALVPLALNAQVTSAHLLRAASEPQNWLLYSGSYWSQRQSAYPAHRGQRQDAGTEVDLPGRSVAAEFEATPLVVDGVMHHAADQRRRRSTQKPDACSGSSAPAAG